MPLTPPRNVGFLSLPNAMSMMIQVIMATAVARLVLTTAAVASAPAKYGSPPLKPFQPSHRMPAPTAMNSRLFGTGLLAGPGAAAGPTMAAATKPETPAARWMT